MKIAILVIVFILSSTLALARVDGINFTTSAQAAGGLYLICTPYPVTVLQPTHFNVTITPLAPVDIPATKNADSSVQLHYDISGLGLAAGSHTATLTAVIIDPIYGRFETGPSLPFPFPPKPTLPTVPVGVGLSTN